MGKIKLENISAKVEDKDILKDITLEINQGEVIVLMGPNGAGKSTITNVIMGNPKYEITSGKVYLDDEDITDMPSNERAKKGVFMSFQHPAEISGITMMNFLRTAYNSLKDKNENAVTFKKILTEKMNILEMDSKFRSRFLNAGFSGGEKKRSEILQLLLFEPRFAMLDEIDSGLDVDALKIVAKGIEKVRKETNMGIIIITHYNKILDYIKPDKVAILKKGELTEIGGKELIKKIEEHGFA